MNYPRANSWGEPGFIPAALASCLARGTVTARFQEVRREKLRWMANTSPEFWILVVTIAVLLLLVVPWLMLHPPAPVD